MILARLCLSAALGLLTAGAALAQTDPRFQTVLALPQHRSAVLAVAQHSTTWANRACANAGFTPLPTVSIWRQPAFDPIGRLSAGVWGERVRATGCGVTRLLNVQTGVTAPNALSTSVLAPGDTTADPVLQKDAARYVFIAALARMPDCKQAFIDDTQVIGPKLERWTVIACTQTRIVEIRFVPTPGGGTNVVAHVPEP